MKCIIAGSRSFAPQPRDSLAVCGEKLELIDLYILNAIKESGYEITEVVSGCARGIDSGGERWAKRMGIEIKQFPAKWMINGGYNPRAGFQRNKQMRIYSDCGVVVWDGQSGGSYNMIEELRMARKPVHVYIPEILGFTYSQIKHEDMFSSPFRGK